MKKKAELTKREWLFLSAYLDGELSSRKKRRVEELLQSKPASREALEVLRRTRQVLKYTPTYKVPKNFTLSAEMVRKPLLPSFSNVLSYSSALAGILLVIVFGLDIFSNSMMTNEATLRTVADEAQVEMFEEAPVAESAQSPAIIEWEESPAGKGGYGLGGADDGGGMASGMGGGGGAPAPAVEVDPEILFDEEEGEAIEAAPAEELAEPQEKTADEAEQSDNLILGVQPEEQRGQITADRPVLPPRETRVQAFSWRLVELVLAAVTLLTGLGAYALRRRQK